MSRSLTEYAAYLFDIDGTLLRPGSTIPGAVEALQALKANGKLIRAVTNNSRMAHHLVAERFRQFGLPLDDDEVFSALRATARFIAHERPGATVYPFGADGLIYELEESGLVVTDQDNADYVVAGYFPEINLESMKQAMRALLNGARFVAVNTDRRYVGDDGPIPGAGAFVAAIERAAGRTPDVVVGKPSITIVEEAVASVGLAAGECLFVGDNIETDVLAAHAVGLPSLLVWTGVSTPADLADSGVQVAHVAESVRALADAFDR
ncbi:MAG: HAD-IIA family hydrolase [Chloroflexota bacterium]